MEKVIPSILDMLFTIPSPQTIYMVFAVHLIYWICNELSGFHIIRENTIGIVERFGRPYRALQPGLCWIVPGIDKVIGVLQTHELSTSIMLGKYNFEYVNGNVKMVEMLDITLKYEIRDPLKAFYTLTNPKLKSHILSLFDDYCKAANTRPLFLLHDGAVYHLNFTPRWKIDGLLIKDINVLEVNENPPKQQNTVQKRRRSSRLNVK